MSEVAGRMSIQVGAAALEASRGGRGVLLGGVPGVRPGKVVVIGGGVVGVAAATIAHGMRADVTIMDLDLKRLGQIDQIFAGNVKTLASSSYEIEREVMAADLVVGAVLVHGAKAPKLVSNALVKKMKPGSVLVDVAIDQGGCFEDSKPTTHQDPTYKVHDAIFYCVANMPGAVPATSTYALANATIKYGLALANKGWQKALSEDGNLAKGLNVHEGKIMYEAVAKAHNL
jgi:alanine dehydrogenase